VFGGAHRCPPKNVGGNKLGRQPGPRCFPDWERSGRVRAQAQAGRNRRSRPRCSNTIHRGGLAYSFHPQANGGMDDEPPSRVTLSDSPARRTRSGLTDRSNERVSNRSKAFEKASAAAAVSLLQPQEAIWRSAKVLRAHWYGRTAGAVGSGINPTNSRSEGKIDGRGKGRSR